MMKTKTHITVTLTRAEAEAIRLLANYALTSSLGLGYFSGQEYATAKRGLHKFIRAEGFEPAEQSGRVGYKLNPNASLHGITFSEK